MAALQQWLSQLDGLDCTQLVPASDDASFRRYFRLQDGAESFIVMDARPDREDSRPFVQIAGFLQEMGLNVPRVIAADVEAGFLLLSDLGATHYLDALTATPEHAESLYDDAIAALLVLHDRGRSRQSQLPPYDEQLLRNELALFRDWLCGTHLQLTFSRAEESAWRQLCDRLVANALQQPRVFVHRDYHSRNLMVNATNNPGILDFQDAVCGPLTYDLVSLLKDCYIRLAPQDVVRRALAFHAQLDPVEMSGDEFLQQFELMGVQRHLKASGIFCRLNHRDGKARYLDDVPQTLGYIVELGATHSELSFITDLIDQRILPAWTTTPCAR